jgi:predicted Rossmann-fold nucleotide-binding protein
VSVCGFCGSSPGAHADYVAVARDLGSGLAGAGERVVYGGASVGLMGALADAALAAEGFLRPEHRARLTVADGPEAVLDAVRR